MKDAKLNDTDILVVLGVITILSKLVKLIIVIHFWLTRVTDSFELPWWYQELSLDSLGEPRVL